MEKKKKILLRFCISAGTLLLLLILALVLQQCSRVKIPANPYSPQDYRWENGLLICTAGETVMGVDVSQHQGDVDWQQVADAGVKFAFLRVGNRGYQEGKLSADTRFEENYAGAKAAGLKVGAYFFSQAVSVEEAQEEAVFALNILNGRELELPLVYDWEYVSEEARTAQLSGKILTDCTLAFCQAAEAAGYQSMIYFNKSQALNRLELRRLEEYPMWLAMYDTDMTFPYRVDCWQYSSKGSLPGIGGNVDLNLLYTQWGINAPVRCGRPVSGSVPPGETAGRLPPN